MIDGVQTYWVYRMMNTPRPLEEKLTLFWHCLFATAYSKVPNARVLRYQIQMFREHGLGSFRELLVALARDPAMIFWLDLASATASSCRGCRGMPSSCAMPPMGDSTMRRVCTPKRRAISA